jgi:hypothetical protein
MSTPIQVQTQEPQIQQRPVCWLCEKTIGLGWPTDKVNGQVVDSQCAKFQGFRIESVFYFARGVKPKELAREMFGKDFYSLTIAQLDAMIEHLKANLPKPREHYHACFQCGERLECYRDNCTERFGECRPCHEGFTRSEWNRYHRKYGY